VEIRDFTDKLPKQMMDNFEKVELGNPKFSRGVVAGNQSMLLKGVARYSLPLDFNKDNVEM
jgi:hypothetical protein